MDGDAALGDLDALRESLAAGRALPSNWYTDRDIFAVETREVLRRSWHFAAHRDELAEIGDQWPVEVAGVPIVLVRDGDGSVKGFVNICRHRAHVVVLEPRNRKAMTCAYHGWSYGLDGSLKHAPRSEYEPGFDFSDCGLAPVQVATWGPTIWVNPDVSAPPFSTWIAGLDDHVRENGIEIERYAYAFEGTWEIHANWKVFVDNAIECYHCPVAHPSLSRIIETDPTLSQLEVGGRNWSSHRTPLRRVDGDTAPPRVYWFHWIWPTTYFQYAGAGFDIGTIQVVDVDRIVFRHLTFAADDVDAATMEARRARLEADPTIPEDVAICERVQFAHASGAARPGRLLPGSEELVHYFQDVLVDTLASARG